MQSPLFYLYPISPEGMMAFQDNTGTSLLDAENMRNTLHGSLDGKVAPACHGITAS